MKGKESMGEHDSGVVASGFFAMRTPLLPFQVLVDWGEELKAAQAAPGEREAALARDRALLRERLRHQLADAVVREALFIASPSLVDSLPTWEQEPDSERGQKVERTLVRYLARMAGRATPFGLFAGNSVGRLAEDTRLHLPGREALRRHTRLDMDYVCALVERVRQLPEVLPTLRYVPNSSLYALAGRLRFLEMRVRSRGLRTYHLVAVESSPYLEATLARARGGVLLSELAEALMGDDPDISREEAFSFVETLVAEQLLLPTWAPIVTGPEPVPHLIARAEGIPALAQVRERLAAVQRDLALLDQQPLGLAPAAYGEVARSLEALPAPLELPRLFQVDMFRATPDATLARPVVDEVLRGAEALRRLVPSRGDSHPLERFRLRFLERYEGRSVPLTEALDEENGIGSVLTLGAGKVTGPLLRGFVFPREGQADPGGWAPRWTHLLRRLEQVHRTQAHELVLTEEDVAAMEVPRPAPLPDAFSVVACLVADSSEAVDQGRFRLFLENLHAPGSLYLGRFCHGDPVLEAHVREHLRAEDSLRPDAVVAEVVHLPQDRMGNVSCRPLLRPHDIVFLGESGAAEEQRILVSDLWVSVEGNRLVLRSQRLGREVLPRMSNAHNYAAYGLGIYRFLALMQHQHLSGLRFSWGPLSNAAFLPRVVYGRTVFSLACWNMEASVLKAWGKARGAERFEAVQRFRREARLPRWVCLRDQDNQLPIDLDNVLCVETLVQAVKERPAAVLEELYPGPEELCVRGQEGGYVHELILPFVRKAPSEVPAATRRAPALPPPAPRRTFPPGSEWLYLKLYSGPVTLERLLGGALGEAVRQAVASGAVDRWFFIRYQDPEPHLRLRFHGASERLLAEVLPRLSAACAAVLEEGSGWRVQLDTYQREVERYGGPVGIALAEELFQADSEAVLDLLQSYGGEAGSEARWRLALKGMDALLDDLGLSLEEKLQVVTHARASFGAEFRVDKAFEVQLGERYRKESRLLEALLAGEPQPAEEWAAGLLALQQRSVRLRPVAERLRQAASEGRLELPLHQLADSYLHMYANRLLTDEQRPQELLLHDFLCRLYRSRSARMKKGT
ncbi:lantibiotic dehydratase [Archangium sp.]|uniref:lantibiotic dehydratase n=1 Tax=Archangium sp. TaxID=1872627 RepID=UPI00286A1530|nr:lantibiotic dehydratase [Archangium sp.]